MLNEILVAVASLPLLLSGPAAGTLILPGQLINLEWTGGNPAFDLMNINVNYLHDQQTHVETLGQVPNTGYYDWRVPGDFQSPAVKVVITETDLLTYGEMAEGETFVVGERAAAGWSGASGLVVNEAGVYYYVSEGWQLRPFVSQDLATSFDLTSATLIDDADMAALPMGRPMLPAIGNYVRVATVPGLWQVVEGGDGVRLVPVRVEFEGAVYTLPVTMAWALR